MAKEFNLSAKEIKDNFNKFFKLLEKHFPERYPQLKKMYDDLGEERIMFAPGSGFDYFHNAIPGGYVDHILRVVEFAEKNYNYYKENGLNVSNFTLQELLFAAFHHDLGKLGMIGEDNEYYVINDSKWHKENQGKIYNANEKLDYLFIQDRSLFLLQQYGIKCTFNEWLGIKIHDGIYDDSNKPYYVTYNKFHKLRNNLPQILHEADMIAARWEFERWNKYSEEIPGMFIIKKEQPVTELIDNKEINNTSVKENIDDIFNNLFA